MQGLGLQFASRLKSSANEDKIATAKGRLLPADCFQAQELCESGPKATAKAELCLVSQKSILLPFLQIASRLKSSANEHQQQSQRQSSAFVSQKLR